MSEFDTELNCEELYCPLPLLKTKKAINSMSSGQLLKMTATDPGTIKGMDSWTMRTENKLVSHAESSGVHTFIIEKK
jgi:tRNA 2-thiouridine synthesizing protein A